MALFNTGIKKLGKKSKMNNATLKLNTKPHSGFGIAAFVLAVVVILLSGIAIYISAFTRPVSEKGLITIGVLGWISAMLTLTGTGLAIMGELTDDREQIFSHISLVFHIIGLIYHGIVVGVGFF